MELQSAVELIRGGVTPSGKQTWADLGAGSGLFTNALSTLLPRGSSIMAVDKKPSEITVANGIHLETRVADFTTTDIKQVDGVLMANSLHYVKEKQSFLESLKTTRLILVEYDTDNSNQWVPYPISFKNLKLIYPEAKQIGHGKSAYHKEGIYAALILF